MMLMRMSVVRNESPIYITMDISGGGGGWRWPQGRARSTVRRNTSFTFNIARGTMNPEIDSVTQVHWLKIQPFIIRSHTNQTGFQGSPYTHNRSYHHVPFPLQCHNFAIWCDVELRWAIARVVFWAAIAYQLQRRDTPCDIQPGTKSLLICFLSFSSLPGSGITYFHFILALCDGAADS